MEADEKRLQTELKIQKAFIKIVNEKSFDKLTISALIKEAKINRGTFYIHYLDKYDLKSHYEDEIILGIKSIFSNYAKPDSLKNQNNDDAFLQLFKYLYRQRSLAEILLTDFGSEFINEIKNLILNLARNDSIKDNILPQSFASEMLTQDILNFLIYWLMQTPVLKPQKIYEIFLYTRKLTPEQLSYKCT